MAITRILVVDPSCTLCGGSGIIIESLSGTHLKNITTNTKMCTCVHAEEFNLIRERSRRINSELLLKQFSGR